MIGAVLFGFLAVILICGAHVFGWWAASAIDRWRERRRRPASKYDERARQYREWQARLLARD